MTALPDLKSLPIHVLRQGCTSAVPDLSDSEARGHVQRWEDSLYTQGSPLPWGLTHSIHGGIAHLAVCAPVRVFAAKTAPVMDGFPSQWAWVCPNHQRGRTWPVLILVSLVWDKAAHFCESGKRVPCLGQPFGPSEPAPAFPLSRADPGPPPSRGHLVPADTAGSVGRCVWAGVQRHCGSSRPHVGLWTVLQSPSRAGWGPGRGETRWRSRPRSPVMTWYLRRCLRSLCCCWLSLTDRTRSPCLQH